MELLPHSEFSKLHIGQFLPPDTYTEDDAGLEQSVLGFNRCQHYFMARNGWLMFYYAESPPTVLSGIDISLLDAELPTGVPALVAEACAPMLRAGIQIHDVTELFGSPDFENSDGSESGFYRFQVGRRWAYRVGCHFRAADGLSGFWIVRGDHFDDDDL